MYKFISPRTVVCVLALAAGFAWPAAAETGILKIDWELSKLQDKKRLPFAPVAVLKAFPGVRFTDRLRSVITLNNTSAKKVEGLVIRYSLRLRLLKAGDAQDKAFWGVPFYVEEVRVAAVGAMSTRSARVLNFGISDQLNKLRNSGFVPVALKLEAMLCPRQGDTPSEIMKESVIEIQKP
ncbi:MAG: hypothetical protein A2285_00905 [Elusimicrobia bacterium RIFOXYA12_FULL_57_11]|nr:MAG: hypothetical protein A2285_00905 [Elusimicrobia bacterium RIFOXYA12_FULL_57_11]